MYVFGNRVAGSGLNRAYQGKRESDHRTSEYLRSDSLSVGTTVNRRGNVRYRTYRASYD
jgi:hypothetical protein